MIELNDVDEAARGRPAPTSCTCREPKVEGAKCWWCGLPSSGGMSTCSL